MVTITQMNWSKLTIIATILLASTTLATGSPAEITIFPEESSTRIDSFTSYEAEIENVGPVEDTYTFTSESTSEIDTAPRQVNLEPGQSETVNIWYNPSQDKEEGTYSYTVTAESRATGQRYQTSITASVIRDYNVNLDADRTTQTVCRGETATYTIEVTNKGIQQEQYQLETDYGQLTQNTVTLEDGETKTVKLTASGDRTTTENFNIRATSTTTAHSQDIQNIQFNAEPCYQSETEITPTEQEAAGGTTTSFDVNIRNTGTKEDEFTLTSNMGRFSENPVTVDRQSTEKVQLEVNPEDLGKNTINIQSEGKSKSTANASLNTYNGNNMEVSYTTPGRNVCKESETAALQTRIENTGVTEETFNLTTNRGKLQKNTLTLEPGQSETANTVIDATELETGENKAQTTVTATTYEQPQKIATNNFQVEDCFNVEINAVPQVASAGENSSVIYNINVENTGTRENIYELSQYGPSWVSIKPKTLEIEPGQTKTSYMYAGIPFKKKGNVQITATARGVKSEDSQTVELVINQKIEEAIQAKEDKASNNITGNLASKVTQTGTAIKLLIAILIATVITAAILVKEW